jgi:hypothetical protein
MTTRPLLRIYKHPNKLGSDAPSFRLANHPLLNFCGVFVASKNIIGQGHNLIQPKCVLTSITAPTTRSSLRRFRDDSILSNRNIL